jgi:hypothetical protein
MTEPTLKRRWAIQGGPNTANSSIDDKELEVLSNWRGHDDVMQTRSIRGSGEPAWVCASLNACLRLGPDPREALWPAAFTAHKQAGHILLGFTRVGLDQCTNVDRGRRTNGLQRARLEMSAFGGKADMRVERFNSAYDPKRWHRVSNGWRRADRHICLGALSFQRQPINTGRRESA